MFARIATAIAAGLSNLNTSWPRNQSERASTSITIGHLELPAREIAESAIPSLWIPGKGGTKDQLGLFDLEDRYAQISKAGDPLEKFEAAIDFEPFHYRLNKALKRPDGLKGGRSPTTPF